MQLYEEENIGKDKSEVRSESELTNTLNTLSIPYLAFNP